jgi:hypothetical protein
MFIINSLQEDLYKLSSEEKKLFVVSLVNGKIRVGRGWLEEGEEGPEWLRENF